MDFNKLNGLIPAIIQDARTNTVLMLGFMNPEALEKTRQEGKVTFFSRTKNRLWTKGEESGNFLHVVEILEDCDQDTLLIKANPQGPVCHTGSDTCFNEENTPSQKAAGIAFLAELQQLIHTRKAEMPKDPIPPPSLGKGSTKSPRRWERRLWNWLLNPRTTTTNSSSMRQPTLYHLLVLLSAKGKDIKDVVSILEQRH